MYPEYSVGFGLGRGLFTGCEDRFRGLVSQVAAKDLVQGDEAGEFAGRDLAEIEGFEPGGGQFVEDGFERIEGAQAVGGVLFFDAAIALLTAVDDAIEGVEQEAQFACGVDAAFVSAVVGVAESLEEVEELVAGEGFDDLRAVLLEFSEIAGARSRASSSFARRFGGG